MRQYQIGCVVEPWINLTPPIRGGVFRLYPEQEDVLSSDDDLSVASTLTASTNTTRHNSNESLPDRCRRRKDGPPSRPPPKRHVDEAFVTKLVQGEIDDNLRDYPSLDTDTQQSINQKFRALHQRVKDEGYYYCNLSEYAKESSRYALLFMCFLVTLRTGWYLTSAGFLGLFWVCSNHHPHGLGAC